MFAAIGRVSMDRLINVLVTITLAEMMLAIGLNVTVAELLCVARDWRLMLRATVANYVFIPVATVCLLLLIQPQPVVAAGFLILAVCPGAPYGPSFTAIAKGNVAVAVGLMVLLAASSVVIGPLILRLLLPLVLDNQGTHIDATKVVGILVLTQLLPLSIGIALRQWRPPLAACLQRPANLASNFLNVGLIGLILAVQVKLLMEIRPLGFFGMIGLVSISWLAGWALSGPTETRKAAAVTSSLRNVGVALVIATSTFAGTAAVTAVVAFGLVSLFGTLGLAKLAHVVMPPARYRRDTPVA